MEVVGCVVWLNRVRHGTRDLIGNPDEKEAEGGQRSDGLRASDSVQKHTELR